MTDTKLQRAADELDLQIFNTARRMFQFGEERAIRRDEKAEIDKAANALLSIRSVVRRHMNPTRRKETDEH